MIVAVELVAMKGVDQEPLGPLDKGDFGYEDLVHVRAGDEIELPDGTIFAVRLRRFKFTPAGAELTLFVEILWAPSIPVIEAAA